MTFDVRFWGVRGTIACPSTSHIKYGGNTSCIEVMVGDRTIIFDAGTGIRNLGTELMKRDVREAHLLMSHTHWDHINGFPFFVPAYDPNRSLHIMAGHLADNDNGGIQDVLTAQMISPMFPVPLETMQAKLRFEDFKAGEKFKLYSDVNIKTAPLRHPNGATGYRIEHNGKSVCYITDTEHVPGEPDQKILELIEGSDLVIYDSTYTEEEFVTKVGWGHSTWNEGLALCQAANVKKFAIFHHEPDHDDNFVDGIEAEAQAKWEHSFAAREGMVVSLD
jgi:phosphoribosyl 1,2-cyclic phosphodiesterase